MTATRIVPQDAPTLASDAELAAHAADTTSVHGIADTSLLSTTAHDHDADYEAAGGIATHSADTTAVHGIVDTSALSLTSHDHDADYEAAGGIATHSADTTAVHGVADTSVLATATDVSTAVATHTGDTADAHDASAVSFAPAGAIAATDVQAAIEELDTEKSGTAHTHAHSATTGQTANDHHNQAHVVTGADHTASGLTIGHVLTASSSTAFGFAAPAGGNDPRIVHKNLGSDFVSAASPVTTMAKATNLDQALSTGTWVFEYHCMWQTSATATAIKLGVNFSGTASRFVAEATGFEATTAASTGVETATHAAFGLRAGGQNNAPSTTAVIFGPTATATQNADYYTVIRGLIVVTVAGDLQLYFGSEATGSTQTLELPTSLIAHKIA